MRATSASGDVTTWQSWADRERQDSEEEGASAAAKAPPLQKPQGKDKKRTPQSAFDPVTGKDVYEPELSLFLFHE